MCLRYTQTYFYKMTPHKNYVYNFHIAQWREVLFSKTLIKGKMLYEWLAGWLAEERIIFSVCIFWIGNKHQWKRIWVCFRTYNNITFPFSFLCIFVRMYNTTADAFIQQSTPQRVVYIFLFTRRVLNSLYFFFFIIKLSWFMYF